MERVRCSCANCARCLGEFLNLWTKIGKSYISPVVCNSGNGLSIVPTGLARIGDEQTLVDAIFKMWRVLDAMPLLVSDAWIRPSIMSCMMITSLDGNEGVELSIQRTLKLKDPSRIGFTATNTPPTSENGTHISTNNDGPSGSHDRLINHLQADLDTQREEIQRLDRAGCHIVSSLNDTVLRIEGEMKKLKEGMTYLREDLKHQHSRATDMENDVASLRNDVSETTKMSQDKSTYNHFEREIAWTNHFVTEVRANLSHRLDNLAGEQKQKHDTLLSALSRTQHDLICMQEELDGTREAMKGSVAAAKVYAKEVSSLRAELKQLREERAREQSRRSPSEPVFPAREIDVLTTTIANIGQRASHVESLQMEFELLKGRVQRMESSRKQVVKDPVDVGIHHSKHLLNAQSEASNRKRAYSFQQEDTTNPDVSIGTSSTKRPILTSWSSSPPKDSDSRNSPSFRRAQRLSTNTPDRLRRTKSGAIDRRSLRKGTGRTMMEDKASND
ncbi:hypothetical protein AAE478_000123 [Parahypoxylon ruwenzoriense]